MRRLMLLRHAKAAPQGALADENRPLTGRGRQDMAAIAAFVASRRLTPDLALISPAIRTRETWDLLLPAFAAAPPHRFDPRLYAASAERILDLVREISGHICQANSPMNPATRKTAPPSPLTIVVAPT